MPNTKSCAFIRYSIAFALWIHLTGCVTSGTISSSEELNFKGMLSRESIDRLKVEARNMPNLQWLVVDSVGGDAMLGMELGDWIADRGLNVRVRHICGSACANYIFTAGRQKIIERGALVAWHGSAQQSMLRNQLASDLDAYMAELIESDARVRAMSVGEREVIKTLKEKEIEEGVASLIRREKRFFKRIGVSACIALIGQVTGKAQGFWYMSVADMARFGVNGVTTPGDYVADIGDEFKSKAGISLIEITDADMQHCPDAK